MLVLKAPRLKPGGIALAGKSKVSTGDENDPVKLECNIIAYIVKYVFVFSLYFRIFFPHDQPKRCVLMRKE